ncbi:MAG: glycosyltransferase, partial [Candidatus Acidiferrales bacterium]
FSPRIDTCQGARTRILFVGYIRPEKGIEYLLEAVAQMKDEVPWELEIAGPSDFPAYRRKLDEIVAARNLHGRVRWRGYLAYGQPLFDRMRAADIFVLPTLSEGTPHVLVEARASGLPCVSTTVGGVPSTVTHGVDALLVPPKDPRALARALKRIIHDGELRRSLIRNGLVSARQQTLGRFTDKVLKELEVPFESGNSVVSPEYGPRA